MARLDKPVGIMLLLLPCWFGLALSGSVNILLYIAFALGAISMRSAGCVFNDIVDRKFDAQVERTKNRPLASGEIKLFHGILFFVFWLFCGAIILLTLPKLAIYIGLAFLPLVIAYPFMKRITYWPQAFLGLCFNSGVLIATATKLETVTLTSIILYIGCIFWTLGYDTIYAIQDKKDDEKIGVKSTALMFGESLRKYVAVFYIIFISMVSLAAFFEYPFNQTSLILLALTFGHLAWQVISVKSDNEQKASDLFKSNVFTGFLVLGFLLSLSLA